jgi:HAE1 family hydrophobic/amphiphilic exporter-1
LNYTQKVLDEAGKILRDRPEVESAVEIGGFSFSGTSPNNGIIFATLKPWEERKRPGQSAPEIVNQLRGPLLGGISEGLVIPIDPPAIQGLGTGGGLDLQLQDRTLNDFNALQQTGMGLFMQSQQRPELQVNPPTFTANAPQLLITVDRDRARLLGVEPEEIFNTLQTALGGNYVNDFDAFNRSYRVYVQADEAFRSSVSDIGQFYVRSETTGEMISLDTLASVEQISAPQIINHYNLFRSSQIQGNSSPGFSTGQAIQAIEELIAQLLPQGMAFEWTGISLEQLESGGQSAFIFLLGIVFVFLVLAAQYESYIDPLIIMLAVPLAVLGALSFQMLRGLSNDIFCQVGLVMLIGLASKNSILIVEFANQLREQGLSIVKAAVEAAQSRFRAILMTAFTFILGVIPLVLATGAGAGSRRSLGTTVFGGMLVSTLLSLLVVPVLYIAIKNLEERLWRKPTVAAVGGGTVHLGDRDWETADGGGYPNGDGVSRHGKPDVDVETRSAAGQDGHN